MKEIIETEKAMKPIHPYYAQGIKARGQSMVFVSGQTWDPRGDPRGKGDVRFQTEQALQGLRAVLEAGGARIKDVVKVTVYLRNIRDLDKIAEVRNRYFKASPPASTLVEVSKLWHEDVLVEIDAVAVT